MIAEEIAPNLGKRGARVERHGCARYSDVPIPETAWEQESARRRRRVK